MAESTKSLSEYDANQITQKVFNTESATLGVDGFVAGKIGRKISLAITTTSVTNDTEVWTFSEDTVVLYELTVLYTDGNRTQLISVERTA